MSDINVPEFPGRKLNWSLRFKEVFYVGSREEVKAGWWQCQANNIPASLSSETASKWCLTVPASHVERIAKLPAITKEAALAQHLATTSCDDDIATF